MCLYDYVASYEKTKLGARRQELRFAAQHAQHDTHGTRKRTLPAVPDIIGPRTPNRNSLADASAANAANKSITDATNYCKSTMILFRSFRSIDALAPPLPPAQPSIDDDNDAVEQHDDNDKRREYRRWRAAFDAWQPDANIQQLLNNTQLYYDSQRDAAVARAAQSAVDAAARRAGNAGGAAFEANAGDGDERLNGDVHEALMEHAAERERTRLAQALDSDVASINNHVKINVDYRNRHQSIDMSQLDIDALQAAIDAANRERGADSSTTTHNENNAQQQQQFNYSTRPLTVQLIDDSVSTNNAQFANEADTAARRAMLLAVSRPTIVDVAEAFTLNAEQREAFAIAATAVIEAIRHRMPSSSSPSPTPTRLLIAGAGGCGKSRIIDALRHFTNAWNVPHAVIVAAYTGNAAVLLRGRTVHNALGLQARSNKKTTTDNHSANLKRYIQSATVFVIDEVSMISLALLHKIDTQLRALRETDQPFGGMSIVFSGDLLQLAPIGGDALWDTTSTRSECVKGRELWRLVDSVVFLRVNMRSLADERYAAALERIRYGEWRDEDVALINSRLLGETLLLETDDAPAIVHTNASRCSINRCRIFCFLSMAPRIQLKVNTSDERIALANASLQLPAGSIVCVKGVIEATKHGYEPSEDDILLLLDADDNKDSNLSPTSYFYEGQRVMITENVATSLGAANGAQGTIVAIKHADDDSRQQQRVRLIEGIAPVMTMCDPMPSVVLVQLRNASAATPICQLAALPPNVFPVLPIKKAFMTKLNSNKSLTVKLSQFPLVPTSAITVHKVQGQSMDRVIVTKWRDPKMVSQYPMTAYVALSRVRTLAGLYITHLLTKADCEFFVPPLAVIDELERLDKLQPHHLRSSDDVLRARRAPAEARALQLQQQQSSKKRKR